jgi:hypothetical protein
MGFALVVDGVAYTRAVVSIDGDHACALLGPNLQEGEAEFYPVAGVAVMVAMHRAVAALAKRLDLSDLAYDVQDSEVVLPSIY